MSLIVNYEKIYLPISNLKKKTTLFCHFVFCDNIAF